MLRGLGALSSKRASFRTLFLRHLPAERTRIPYAEMQYAHTPDVPGITRRFAHATVRKILTNTRLRYATATFLKSQVF